MPLPYLKNSKASCSCVGSLEEAALPLPMLPSLPIAAPVMCRTSCPRPPKISVTAPLSAFVSDMTRLPACSARLSSKWARVRIRVGVRVRLRVRARARVRVRVSLQREGLEEVVDGHVLKGGEGELLDQYRSGQG